MAKRRIANPEIAGSIPALRSTVTGRIYPKVRHMNLTQHKAIVTWKNALDEIYDNPKGDITKDDIAINVDYAMVEIRIARLAVLARHKLTCERVA